MHGRADAAARRDRGGRQDHEMVQVGRRRGQAGRQPVRDRDRQGVDGGAVDHRRRARRDPRARGRGGAGRRHRRGDRRWRRRAASAQCSLRPHCAGCRRAGRKPRRRPRARRPLIAVAARTGSAVKLDPFFEVRTPARNYGPARLAGGTRVTPLARRLAAEGGIDLGKISPSGPHGRIVARDVEAARARSPRRAPAPPARGPSPPSRSRRSTATCRSRRCRSTACARPSPRGWCRPSRPSRIST